MAAGPARGFFFPFFFLSNAFLLLAYGTMGIEMAIAPLWVERQMEDDEVIK